MSWPRAVLAVAVLAQLAGGVLAFSLAPDVVFADIGSDPLARTCLRLAAWANLSAAMVGGWLVARGEGLVVLGVAHLVYHLLAAVEGGLAWASDGVVLAAPQLGPLGFHSVAALALAAALVGLRR